MAFAMPMIAAKEAPETPVLRGLFLLSDWIYHAHRVIFLMEKLSKQL